MSVLPAPWMKHWRWANGSPALLLADYLESQGIAAVAVNAADVIATDALFGNASPLMEPTRQRAAKVLRSLLEKKTLPVMTGFNGSTLDGRA